MDPNVQAAKGDKSAEEEHAACLDMGLLPVVLGTLHLDIIHRWDMAHLIAPAREIHQRSGHTAWKRGVWVDAWVAALFHLVDAMEAWTRAWATLEKNKPKMLDLKIRYDEALNDPERQLLILTEYKLCIARGSHIDNHRALDVAIRNTQREIERNE